MNHVELNKHIKSSQSSRLTRMTQMIEKLDKLGHPGITMEEVCALTSADARWLHLAPSSFDPGRVPGQITQAVNPWRCVVRRRLLQWPACGRHGG